jgi:hypothetical protein
VSIELAFQVGEVAFDQRRYWAPRPRNHAGAPNTPPGIGPGKIRLLYLHGHIDDDARAPQENALVLAEADYADHRDRSRMRLTELLAGRDTAFVSVGASLTDKPLIDALISTKASQTGPMSLLVEY